MSTKPAIPSMAIALLLRLTIRAEAKDEPAAQPDWIYGATFPKTGGAIPTRA